MLAVTSRAAALLEKPTEIVRGRASRLPWAWDKLCFAVPLHEQSRYGMYDIANNVAPNVVNNILWARDNRGNPALSWTTGGAERLEWPDHPRHDSPATALTFYVRVRNKGTSTTDGGLLVNWYDAAAEPWVSWGVQGGSVDPLKLYATLAIGATAHVVGETVAMPTNEYISVFYRWASGLAPQLDVLGERGNVLSTLVGGSTVSGTIGYSAGKNIRLNASEGTTSNYNGVYSQVLVWSRRLNDVEMTALVADPFGWYSPRRETLAISSPFPVFGLANPGLQYIGPTRS